MTTKTACADTNEDLYRWACEARGWQRVYAQAGDYARARREREDAEALEAELARRGVVFNPRRHPSKQGRI